MTLVAYSTEKIKVIVLIKLHVCRRQAGLVQRLLLCWSPFSVVVLACSSWVQLESGNLRERPERADFVLGL